MIKNGLDFTFSIVYNLEKVLKGKFVCEWGGKRSGRGNISRQIMLRKLNLLSTVPQQTISTWLEDQPKLNEKYTASLGNV